MICSIIFEVSSILGGKPVIPFIAILYPSPHIKLSTLWKIFLQFYFLMACFLIFLSSFHSKSYDMPLLFVVWYSLHFLMQSFRTSLISSVHQVCHRFRWVLTRSLYLDIIPLVFSLLFLIAFHYLVYCSAAVLVAMVLTRYQSDYPGLFRWRWIYGR